MRPLIQILAMIGSMTKERELLRRALDDLELQVGRSLDEIRAYLNQSEIPTGCTPSDDAEEPVYLARRKGLDDFFTCSKDRYDELSALDLFETKIAFLHPPRPAEPEAEPVAWPVDREWLRTVLRFAEKNPDYFYDVEPGFISLDSGDTDTIITALNKSASPAARKPMTEEEIDKTMEPWQSRMDVRSDARWGAGFKAGIRYAEKHHFGMGVNPSNPDSIDLQSRCRGDKL
jgi:hypothetical protein